MRWKKSSEYSIQSGDWHIARFLNSRDPIPNKFLLWHGTKLIGAFNSAEEARNGAHRLNTQMLKTKAAVQTEAHDTTGGGICDEDRVSAS